MHDALKNAANPRSFVDGFSPSFLEARILENCQIS